MANTFPNFIFIFFYGFFNDKNDLYKLNKFKFQRNLMSNDKFIFSKRRRLLENHILMNFYDFYDLYVANKLFSIYLQYQGYRICLLDREKNPGVPLTLAIVRSDPFFSAFVRPSLRVADAVYVKLNGILLCYSGSKVFPTVTIVFNIDFS